MQLEEGQIYEGGISLSGGDGPYRRWLVVAPFGKTHIHSIDEPLELHCWPATLVEWGIESGRLTYVGKQSNHPALDVQRIKERLRVRDVHLSISEQSLGRLLDALRDALEMNADCAPYLAGEIFAAATHSALMTGRGEQIVAAVEGLLRDARLAVSPVGLTEVETMTNLPLSPRAGEGIITAMPE